ncbi:hypothetical protein I546_6657 [Mycobacterium kansasii 732]|nr:hypothetical protein I546_6657 [Mycobacterium kansasii 732]
MTDQHPAEQMLRQVLEVELDQIAKLAQDGAPERGRPGGSTAVTR